MMTVHEVSELTGVSIRTLQYYDKIGLLKPCGYSRSGYRYYGDDELRTLQQILLFKELEFKLSDIKEIISRSDFDKKAALDQQIELLKLKKDHINDLLRLARSLRNEEAGVTDFEAFDISKIKAFAEEAKKKWGNTPEYKEFEAKQAGSFGTSSEQETIMEDFMEIFCEFGKIKGGSPDSAPAQSLVRRLQAFISDHFYKCNDKTLAGLGKMYAAGGEFTENIDKAGGKGTGKFVCKAIEAYVKMK